MRRYLFADEAGCFSFRRDQRSSKFFILCTVTTDSCSAGSKLLDLRRNLVWDGLPVKDFFHATEDKQSVRDRVYAAIKDEDFHIEATILEKSKAQPQTRLSNARFYQYAWYYHFMGIRGAVARGADELHIVAASVAQKKQQKAFSSAVQSVVHQYYGQRVAWRTDHPQSSTEPCLQLADYCTWAIQRKWERGDSRPYDLLRSKIRHEYETWRRGTKHYY